MVEISYGKTTIKEEGLSSKELKLQNKVADQTKELRQHLAKQKQEYATAQERNRRNQEFKNLRKESLQLRKDIYATKHPTLSKMGKQLGDLENKIYKKAGKATVKYGTKLANKQIRRFSKPRRTVRVRRSKLGKVTKSSYRRKPRKKKQSEGISDEWFKV